MTPVESLRMEPIEEGGRRQVVLPSGMERVGYGGRAPRAGRAAWLSA